MRCIERTLVTASFVADVNGLSSLFRNQSRGTLDQSSRHTAHYEVGARVDFLIRLRSVAVDRLPADSTELKSFSINYVEEAHKNIDTDCLRGLLDRLSRSSAFSFSSFIRVCCLVLCSALSRLFVSF